MAKVKSNQWNKRIDRLALCFGGCLALVTLLGFCGSSFWLCDLMSHFRVQYFQLSLILIAWSLWRRTHLHLALYALLACVNYALVLPFYFGKPPKPTSETVRAVTMNLKADNRQTQKVLDFIKQADADLVVLEEVSPAWGAALQSADFPYRLEQIQDGYFGIVLLSRYPLSNARVVQIGASGIPSLVADVHLPRSAITVIATHPVPPLNADYSARRDAQLAALPSMADQQKYPVLLMGDLNASPWCAPFRSLLKESGLSNSMDHFGFQPSWSPSARFFTLPIDHILHDPQIVIHHRSLGPDIGSDHVPVWVDLSVLR